MSEFIKQVVCRWTGKRRALPPHYMPTFEELNAEFNTATPKPFGETINEYDFSVEWHERIFVEDRAKLPADLMFRRAIEKLRRALYGDLMESLYKLERHVHYGEHREAVEEIRNVMAIVQETTPEEK